MSKSSPSRYTAHHGPTRDLKVVRKRNPYEHLFVHGSIQDDDEDYEYGGCLEFVGASLEIDGDRLYRFSDGQMNVLVFVNVIEELFRIHPDEGAEVPLSPSLLCSDIDHSESLNDPDTSDDAAGNVRRCS